MTSVVTTIRRGITSSQAVKVPVKAATTANITLSGEQTIDSVACISDDRVLVKNQTDASENGIYAVDTSDWNREPDWDGTHDVKKGTYVYAANGTAGNNFWQVTTADPIVIGTTSVAFQATDPDSLLRSNLADTSAGQGASLVGAEDSEGNFASGNTEGILAELFNKTRTAYCTADTTSNNSTTYVSITGMSLSLEASTDYAVEVLLRLNQAATAADIRLVLLAGSGSIGSGLWEITGNSTSDSAVQAAFTSTGNGVTLTTDVYGFDVVSGKFQIKTSPSYTSIIQFRQDSAVANNTTIKLGSWMRVTKLS